MKKYILPLLCACGIFMTACEDELDITQKGVVFDDGTYTTDADAESARNSMYDIFAQSIANGNNPSIKCQYIQLFNLPGDDVYAAGNFYGDNDFMGQINEFRYDNQNELIREEYRALYRCIYGANLVLQYDEASDVKKQYKAEAKVIRAFAHMTLAIYWKNPPKVDKILTLEDEYPGNTDQKELLLWCAKECEDAIDYLLERENTADKNSTTFVTKGFAQFIAGKCYLFAGEYDKCKSVLGDLIKSGKYELVPGERFRETFHLSGEGNEEIIFATNCQPNGNVGGDWGGIIQKSQWMQHDIWGWRTDKMRGKPASVKGGWGGLGVRADFAEAFIANDGNSARRKASICTVDEWLYEMPYDNEEPDMTREQKETDENRGIISSLYGQSPYLQYKRVCDNDDSFGTWWYSPLNTLIARYAEALLIYCEACAQTNDSDGLLYLNEIQKRAGSAHISTECSLAEVKNEKRFEMFLEGCRFADMVRWGDVDGVLDNGKNIPTLKDHYFDQDEKNKTKKHDIYVEWVHPNKGTTGFVKGKHEYFPFPLEEVSTNLNCQQHENW